MVRDFGGQGAVNQTGGTVVVTPLCGVVGSCASINIGNKGGIGTYAISGGELDIIGGNDVIGRVLGTMMSSLSASRLRNASRREGRLTPRRAQISASMRRSPG